MPFSLLLYKSATKSVILSEDAAALDLKVNIITVAIEKKSATQLFLSMCALAKIKTGQCDESVKNKLASWLYIILVHKLNAASQLKLVQY